MNIETRDEAEIKIVAFEGELATNEAPEAESMLKQLIADGSRKIILDLEKLEFISSAGLRVLLAVAQGLKEKDGGLRLCNLNETVREVFDISGFSTLLQVFDTEGQALSGF